jgi:hypothetical protein
MRLSATLGALFLYSVEVHAGVGPGGECSMKKANV